MIFEHIPVQVLVSSICFTGLRFAVQNRQYILPQVVGMIFEWLPLLAIIVGCLISNAICYAPSGSVKVFVKGEAGYYCHKIPYLLRTHSNTLIAVAEGRGKFGRTACDDYSVSELLFLSFVPFLSYHFCIIKLKYEFCFY